MREGRGMLTPALLYFTEVARCGSIRQAADRLHVASSAVSRQIQLLERELGAPLFFRSRNGVELTEQGRLLVAFTDKAGGDLDRLRGEIGDLSGLRRGHVSIAAVDAAAGRLLPNCLAQFQGDHPGVTLQIRIGGTHTVAESVLQQEAQIGIALDPPFRSELKLRTRWPQPLQAVVHPAHALADCATLPLSAVLAVPHSLPDRTTGTRSLIERAAGEVGIATSPLVETNSLDMARSLAIAGHSATILPPEFVAQDVADGKLRAIPIEDGPLARASIDVFTARTRRLTRAAEAVLEVIAREIWVCANVADGQSP